MLTPQNMVVGSRHRSSSLWVIIVASSDAFQVLSLRARCKRDQRSTVSSLLTTRVAQSPAIRGMLLLSV
jgi:hypothetical protein